MRWTSLALVVFLAGASAPAAAQVAEGGLAVEPYAAYGFFGDLPGSGPDLDAALAFGGRAVYQFSNQLAFFGNYQRATPDESGGREVAVSHWSAGVEFSMVPRGGAAGMLPILLEAGLGQARYNSDWGFGPSADLALNLGIASALPVSERLSIRFGANDYISSYDDGTANQVFVRAGAEFRF